MVLIATTLDQGQVRIIQGQVAGQEYNLYADRDAWLSAEIHTATSWQDCLGDGWQGSNHRE